MKIMLVCTGNICRSAMAHKMLEKMAKDKNKDVEVFSSGIYAYENDSATNTAVQAVKELYNLDLSNHRAKNIKNTDLENMDLILCATLGHKIKLINIYPKYKDKIFTLKEYAGYDKNDLDITDPWGTSLENYKMCAIEIEDSLKAIIDKI